jgi:trehalose-6-phosphate synthase
VEQGGMRWRVEWEDSRSFLSNLRCLLTPQTTSLPSAPGMPPGLSPLSTVEPPDVRWVGMSGVTDPAKFRSVEERTAFEAVLHANRCVPVYMPADTLAGYSSFCRSILWPLLHYLMPTTTNEHVGQQWQSHWNAYLQANAHFADAIVDEMKAAAAAAAPAAQNVQPVVWIHNMQLFCLPQLIRERMPRATIGLFIHTPFPSSDVFRSLPSRREMLEAMMEADLLGFHTFDYARHFLSCIKRVLDLDFETLKVCFINAHGSYPLLAPT